MTDAACAPDRLDERYGRLRLVSPVAERSIRESLEKVGQLHPLVTCPREGVYAVVDGFKIGMGKEKVAAPGGNADDATGFWQIFHGENLVLVDRQLRIRGYFPATPEGIDLLVAAAGRVANGA